MNRLIEFLLDIQPEFRVVGILVLAVLAHFIVRGVRWTGERIVSPDVHDRDHIWRQNPKFATVTTILVSALTFAIYFGAVGLILVELGVDLTTYIATASVIGLAVGFGLQGFVQDVVVGLTLIFSDVLNIGDMVDISGQTGRVQHIGLRFTTLVNVFDQRVNIPNRNIALISRYRRGLIRAYADVQVPEEADPEEIRKTIDTIAQGMRRQFRALILTDPEITDAQTADPGDWRYFRVKFRLWPGQGVLIENAFRQRVLSEVRRTYPGYADWMVTVTYRSF